jgi:hypothetical protein
MEEHSGQITVTSKSRLNKLNIICPCNSMAEWSALNRRVGGSNPLRGIPQDTRDRVQEALRATERGARALGDQRGARALGDQRGTPAAPAPG